MSVKKCFRMLSLAESHEILIFKVTRQSNKLEQPRQQQSEVENSRTRWSRRKMKNVTVALGLQKQQMVLELILFRDYGWLPSWNRFLDRSNWKKYTKRAENWIESYCFISILWSANPCTCPPSLHRCISADSSLVLWLAPFPDAGASQGSLIIFAFLLMYNLAPGHHNCVIYAFIWGSDLEET